MTQKLEQKRSSQVPKKLDSDFSFGQQIGNRISHLCLWKLMKKRRRKTTVQSLYLSGSLQVPKVDVGDEEDGLSLQVSHGLKIGGV